MTWQFFVTFLGWLNDPFRWLFVTSNWEMIRSRIESPGSWFSEEKKQANLPICIFIVGSFQNLGWSQPGFAMVCDSHGKKTLPGNSAGALLEMVKWPFKKAVCDLQRLGMKRSRLESPGYFSLNPACLMTGSWQWFMKYSPHNWGRISSPTYTRNNLPWRFFHCSNLSKLQTRPPLLPRNRLVEWNAQAWIHNLKRGSSVG